MSQTLPGGLRAKTGYLPTGEGQLHYAELGDSERIEMERAVDALREAFDDPYLFSDPRFEAFRRYIKSFYPQTVPDEGGFSSSRMLIPAVEKFPINLKDLEVNSGPSRDLLGHKLTLYDIMGFTHYLLSNTPLDGPEDPRLMWLKELRGDREPPK